MLAWQRMMLMKTQPRWRLSGATQGVCACSQVDTFEATESADNRKRGETHRSL